MNRKTALVLAFQICAAVLGCRAGVVATWNFDNYTGGNGPVNASSWATTAFTGTPTATANAAANVSVLQVPGDPGSAMQFAANAGHNLNSSTLSFSLTANGALTLSSFSYNYITSSGADVSQQWSYSIGGNKAVNIGTAVSPSTSWGTDNQTFSIALAAGQTITFFDTFSGRVAGESLSFDNFSVSAVPEPVTCALSIFGLILGAGAVTRRFLGRRQNADIA